MNEVSISFNFIRTCKFKFTDIEYEAVFMNETKIKATGKMIESKQITVQKCQLR